MATSEDNIPTNNDNIEIADESTEEDILIEETPTEPIEEDIETNKNRYVEVTAASVRVRSSATTDTNDNILGKVNNGDKFEKYDTEGDWSRIDYNGQEGYIKSEYLIEITESEYITKNTVKEDSKLNENEDISNTASSTEIQNNIMQLTIDSNQIQITETPEATSQISNNSGGGTRENAQLGADNIVYVAPNGEVYHYDPDCAGKNAIAKNLNEVGNRRPCKKCVLR